LRLKTIMIRANIRLNAFKNSLKSWKMGIAIMYEVVSIARLDYDVQLCANLSFVMFIVYSMYRIMWLTLLPPSRILLFAFASVTQW